MVYWLNWVEEELLKYNQKMDMVDIFLLVF